MFDVSNPKLWVLVSFVLLLVLSAKKVTQLLFNMLDSRAEKIKSELETARKLRVEAEEVLALYKQKQAEFSKEAENILAKARSDAEMNTNKAKAELKSTLDARLKNAIEKISQEEKAAINEVRNHIIDIALSSARIVIAQQSSDSFQDDLADLIVSDIEHKIH